MIITAPGSTANLGPGFDTLSLALDVHFSISLNEQPRGGAWEPTAETHPAMVAYRQAGGVTELSRIWIQSRIPSGRGMGFSGAARVAGAFAALIQNGQNESDARDHAFRIAGDLETHDDNAAASTYGGFCVATGGHVMRFDCFPKEQGIAIVLFTPETETSTKDSRGKLPTSYSHEEAVGTISRVAMLTAMLASNTFNDQVLGIVTADVIHQPSRIMDGEPSQKAFETFQEAGAIAQWLSGSGPSVAALVPEENTAAIIEKVDQLELGCAFTCAEVGVANDGVHQVIAAHNTED